MRFLITLLALMCVVTAAFAQVEDGEDHPLISRYPGSELVWKETQAFQPYAVAVGPVTGYRTIDEWVALEGKVTRLYYELPGARSLTEVHRNFVQALEQANFTLLAEGLFPESNVGKEVGGRSWQGVMYDRNSLPSNGLIRLLQGSSTTSGSSFIAGKLARAEGDVYVAIGGSQYAEDRVVYLIDVVEVQAMEDGLIVIDAEAMSKEITDYGKTVIYGILFDYDKATIQPESKAALDEVSILLESNPELSVYVVGHTDMKGSLDYNLDLSQRRAEAVVEALVSDYGVARERLEPHGVGPLVPVFTNESDAGRAKNRRVELVER